MKEIILVAIFLILNLIPQTESCSFRYSGYKPREGELAYLPEVGNGTLHWGQCANGEPCSAGKEQSPINIVSEQVVERGEFGELEFESGSLLEIQRSWTGHNQLFKSSSRPENRASWLSHQALQERFELVQYHLHTPSEHTIDGEYFDAEVHLVHMNEARTSLSVIGIMIKQGNESQLSSSFFEDMIHEHHFDSEQQFTKVQAFDPTIFLRELSSSQYFYYKGSLTTPPCSEDVNWFLMKTPLLASPEQISRLKTYQAHNSRPLQPVNGRKVFSSPKQSSSSSASGTKIPNQGVEPSLLPHFLLSYWTEDKLEL